MLHEPLPRVAEECPVLRLWGQGVFLEAVDGLLKDRHEEFPLAGVCAAVTPPQKKLPRQLEIRLELTGVQGSWL